MSKQERGAGIPYSAVENLESCVPSLFVHIHFCHHITTTLHVPSRTKDAESSIQGKGGRKTGTAKLFPSAFILKLATKSAAL